MCIKKTLISLNTLNVSLIKSNRAAAQIPWLEEAIEVSRQLNGVEHKDTLILTENLGLAYLDLNQANA